MAIISRRATILACILLALAPATADAKPPPVPSQWLGAETQGKVVIVNFWATWCAPCRAEMPDIDAWYRAHKAAGVDVVAISMDDPSKAKAVADIAAQFDFATVMARDAHVPSAYRPSQIPLTLIFDRAGVLRFDSRKTPGTIDAALLDKVALPLL